MPFTGLNVQGRLQQFSLSKKRKYLRSHCSIRLTSARCYLWHALGCARDNRHFRAFVISIRPIRQKRLRNFIGHRVWCVAQRRHTLSAKQEFEDVRDRLRSNKLCTPYSRRCGRLYHQFSTLDNGSHISSFSNPNDGSQLLGQCCPSLERVL